MVTGGFKKHECGKRYCNYCNKTQALGHYCYVAPLKPSKLSDKYMYVFSDTECTQDLEKLDGSCGVKQHTVVDSSDIQE